MKKIILNEEFIHKALIASINEIFKKPSNDILKLGSTAVSKKKKFAKQVWAIIQKAYSYLEDGCMSFDPSEGESKEAGNYGFHDFLYGPYVWTLYFNDDKKTIAAVRIFKKTKFGLKSICSANNKDAENSREAYRKIDANYLDNPSMHAYGEISDAPEHLRRKREKPNFVPVDKVKKVLPKKKINDVEDPYFEKEHNIRDKFLNGYNYYRNLGGKTHRKIMTGFPNVK